MAHPVESKKSAPNPEAIAQEMLLFLIYAFFPVAVTIAIALCFGSTLQTP